MSTSRADRLRDAAPTAPRPSRRRRRSQRSPAFAAAGRRGGGLCRPTRRVDTAGRRARCRPPTGRPSCAAPNAPSAGASRACGPRWRRRRCWACWASPGRSSTNTATSRRRASRPAAAGAGAGLRGCWAAASRRHARSTRWPWKAAASCGWNSPSIYKLSVALRNRAGIEVALPALELALTDTGGRLIARKVLLATDLGASQRRARRRPRTGAAGHAAGRAARHRAAWPATPSNSSIPDGDPAVVTLTELPCRH